MKVPLIKCVTEVKRKNPATKKMEIKLLWRTVISDKEFTIHVILMATYGQGHRFLWITSKNLITVRGCNAKASDRSSAKVDILSDHA